MKRPSILTALLVGALLGPADPASADVPAPVLTGIRPLGMGNAFVAVADDRNALHYNPAGLSNLNRVRISGIGVHGGLDNEFFDVVNFIRDKEEQFSDFETIDPEFFDSLAPYDDKWVSADAHAYVDFTRKGLGLGAFTAGRVSFKIDRGVYEPRVHARVTDDIVGVVGAGLDLGRMDLKVGMAVKGIWRREVDRVLTAREVADFSPDDILGELEEATSGFGLDFGLYWQPPDSRFSAGMVVRNAPGVIGGEPIDGALDLGGAWRMARGGTLVRGITVAADVRDTFESDVSFGNKIHLGGEVRIPAVAIRTGFNQGYPTFGATLAARFVSLEYAFYGRELGNFPGAESQFVHAVEARVGFF